MQNNIQKLHTKLFTKDVERRPVRDGFGEGLVEVAEQDERVVGLCADLTESTRMHLFAQKFPERFFNVGVAEQNLVSVASGMAHMNKIPFVALHRIKANLEPVKPKRLYSDFHHDVNCSTMTTGIYYINTNDGYTEFETGEKIMSVANRYVKFPSNIKHRGVSQVDTKVRCVLNLNYFEHIL